MILKSSSHHYYSFFFLRKMVKPSSFLSQESNYFQGAIESTIRVKQEFNLEWIDNNWFLECLQAVINFLIQC